VLAGLTSTGLLGIGGCLGGLSGDSGDDSDVDEDQSGTDGDGTDGAATSDGSGDDAADGDYRPDVPLVEDPPAAVYVPSHRNGMVMRPPVRVGAVGVSAMVTYPHRFWTVTGEVTQLVEVTENNDVHLMITVWDPETGTVLPTDEGLGIEIRRNGRLVDDRSPWAMLSQSMGFHFGDNVSLDGDGTYEITVDVPPLGVRTTGDLADRFTEGSTATVEFAFDQEFRDTVFERNEWVADGTVGVKGALPPSRGGDDGSTTGSGGDGSGLGPPPYSSLPEPSSLPGRVLGEAISGDADLVTTLVPGGSRFADEQYLLVSPRTPYNAVPLPALGLTAIVRRDGERRVSRTLARTVDHETGLHYGTALPELESGDELVLRIDAPPQVSRHQGYETAFLDMPNVSFSVSEVA